MNGVRGPLLLEDAWQVAGMLVQLGRAVPPAEWVDELREEQSLAALEGMI